MAFCPQCGMAVPETAAFCPRCGWSTGNDAVAAQVPAIAGGGFPVPEDAGAAPPEPFAAPRGGMHTVVGMVSPLASAPRAAAADPPVIAVPPAPRTEPVARLAPPAASPATPGPALHSAKQTVVGMVSPFLQNPKPPAASPPGALPGAIHDLPTDAAMGPMASKRTVIGVSAADLGLQRSPVPAGGPAFAGSGTQVLPAPRGAASPGGLGQKTMIGGVALRPVQPAAQPVAGPRIAKNGTVIGLASPLAAGAGKTMPLGVYSPSPTRKTLLGVPVPAFIIPQTEYVEEEYDEMVAETGQMERRVRVVAVPAPPLYKRPAAYVLVAALLIGAGGVAAVVLAPKNAPLRGEAQIDAAGNDVLHVTCGACADGTKLALTGGVPVDVKGGEAFLSVPSPLRVGENQLEVAVDRPASGRDETLRLTVPIAYRIKPDLGSMQGPAPSVNILVEALPGSTATVMGTQVQLGPDGKGVHVIDLRPEITGPSGEATQIVKEVAYTIAVPGQSAQAGKVSVRIGVPLLVLESPTANMVTDAATFMVAGTTAKGSGVSIAGHPLSVDAQGHFAQLMNISSEGTTDAEIRATAPPLAPRIVKIHVRRVASLAAEAKQREPQTKTSYADVLASGASAAGKTVLWKATILEIAAAGAQKVAVLEVANGCAKKPCLARAVLPGGAGVGKGDALTIAGIVIGLVAVRGADVPDLEAEFVVKGP